MNGLVWPFFNPGVLLLTSAMLILQVWLVLLPFQAPNFDHNFWLALSRTVPTHVDWRLTSRKSPPGSCMWAHMCKDKRAVWRQLLDCAICLELLSISISPWIMAAKRVANIRWTVGILVYLASLGRCSLLKNCVQFVIWLNHFNDPSLTSTDVGLNRMIIVFFW